VAVRPYLYRTRGQRPCVRVVGEGAQWASTNDLFRQDRSTHGAITHRQSLSRVDASDRAPTL